MVERLAGARTRKRANSAQQTRTGVRKCEGRKTVLESSARPLALARRVIKLSEKRSADYGWKSIGKDLTEEGLLKKPPHKKVIKDLLMDAKRFLA